jgi:hypothetical protein
VVSRRSEPFFPAASIDEVIDRLAAIIDESRARGERYGLFASLYHRTTVRVRNGIGSGRFEDAARMERLDVLFANRYLEAYARHRAGLAPTDAWGYAFARTPEPEHLVLQHLMLGMNAHINLDLCIAACATCPGDTVVELRQDFFEINRLLAEMVDVVQEDLVAVSPLIGWIDRLAGRGDEALAHAFLNRSRRAAWRKALRLAPLTGAERRSAVRRFDQHTARLARRICPPPQAQPSWLQAVKAREESDLEAIYEVLG